MIRGRPTALYYYAFNKVTGLPVDSDGGNHTLYLTREKGGTGLSSLTTLADTPEWLGASGGRSGWYLINITISEGDYDSILFTGVSSTENVMILPQTHFPMRKELDRAGARLGGSKAVHVYDTGVSTFYDRDSEISFTETTNAGGTTATRA